MSVHVSQHAIDRYIERIAPVDPDQARSIIQSAEPAIEFAARFGAHVVRLRSGGKTILRGRGCIRVVTILGNEQIDAETIQSVERPACCGLCGLHCGHPIASVCTRTVCPLGAARRPAANGGSEQ